MVFHFSMMFAIRCSEKIIQCSDSPVSEESALQTLMSIPVATCHQVLLFVSTFLFYPCCAGKLWYVNVQPAVSPFTLFDFYPCIK